MMSTVRTVRLGLFRPTARFTPQLASRRYATGDYGSGSGDPKGENPQSQGPNPSADKEHPGPPPPAAGQNSGSTPTKGTSDGHNTEQSQQNSNKSNNNNKGTQPSSAAGSAQPKILDPDGNAAAKGEGKGGADVEAHNKAFGQRAERADDQQASSSAPKDTSGKDQTVGKNFWAGKNAPPPPPPKFDLPGALFLWFVAAPITGAVGAVAYTLVELMS
ncbi:hypothetical protein MBLNU230_g3371t1 [Neophaeotheca triangularis]